MPLPTITDAKAVLHLLSTQSPAPTAMNPARVTLELQEGEASWHPAATHSAITGPCTVVYEQYFDGGINAIVK